MAFYRINRQFVHIDSGTWIYLVQYQMDGNTSDDLHYSILESYIKSDSYHDALYSINNSDIVFRTHPFHGDVLSHGPYHSERITLADYASSSIEEILSLLEDIRSQNYSPNDKNDDLNLIKAYVAKEAMSVYRLRLTFDGSQHDRSQEHVLSYTHLDYYREFVVIDQTNNSLLSIAIARD